MSNENETTNNAPDAVSNRFEELTTALHDTEEFVASLQATEENRKHVQAARLAKTREEYQVAMDVMAQTRGQISLLSEQLATQGKECCRLAGIIEYVQYTSD